MLLSKCAKCDSKKSRSIKNQEANGLLSNLRVRTPLTHLATRRRGNVVATSLCTPQQRRKYVSNETPNDVSMERRQDVSVIHLHDILLERCDHVSRGHNKKVSSVRLHNDLSKSQMKHSTKSRWYITKTSQWYVSTVFSVSPK